MGEKYKQGMVAQLLGGGKSPSGGKLATFFTVPPAAEVPEPLIPKTANGQKKKKVTLKSMKSEKSPSRKKTKVQDSENHERESGQLETSPQPLARSEGFSPPPGIVHVALREASQKSGKKRKKSAVDDEDDEEDGNRKEIKEDKRPRRDRLKKASEKRTIFVGNVPLTTNKKKLTRLFKEFGEIESVRFRCAPVGNPATKKKVAVIMKEFHDKRNNISAYICFKEEEAAKKAVSLNGHLLDGFHLRVDSAKPVLKNLSKRSVFVGNLPFGIEEESIRQHFEDCGDIENVRVVRDRKTNLGKGICYILFKSSDSVSLALQLRNTELEKRQLRVERCVSSSSKKDTKSKKLKMKQTNIDQKAQNRRANTDQKTQNKRANTDRKFKRKNKMWQPTNASTSQVLQTQKTALKKKWRKVEKKRKKKKSRTDEITRILGPLKQPPTKPAGVRKSAVTRKGLTGGKKGKKGAR